MYKVGDKVKVKTAYKIGKKEYHFEGTGIIVSLEERIKHILRERGCDMDDFVSAPEGCFSVKMDKPDEDGCRYFVMHQVCLSLIQPESLVKS